MTEPANCGNPSHKNRRSVDNFQMCHISEEQVIKIAKVAVQLAREDQEREIGRLTKKGLFYVVGAVAVGVFSWAVAHGLIDVNKIK